MTQQEQQEEEEEEEEEQEEEGENVLSITYGFAVGNNVIPVTKSRSAFLSASLRPSRLVISYTGGWQQALWSRPKRRGTSYIYRGFFAQNSVIMRCAKIYVLFHVHTFILKS